MASSLRVFITLPFSMGTPVCNLKIKKILMWKVSIMWSLLVGLLQLKAALIKQFISKKRQYMSTWKLNHMAWSNWFLFVQPVHWCTITNCFSYGLYCSIGRKTTKACFDILALVLQLGLIIFSSGKMQRETITKHPTVHFSFSCFRPAFPDQVITYQLKQVLTGHI